MGQLAERIRAKYPGAYDDMDDAALELAETRKFPGIYDDLVEGGTAVQSNPLPLQRAGGAPAMHSREPHSQLLEPPQRSRRLGQGVPACAPAVESVVDTSDEVSTDESAPA